MAEKIRLQKMLAACGVASRRKSEELIRSGLVLVNGKQAQIGDSIVPTRDRVEYQGQTVQYGQKQIYIALHKPRGFVTTMQDERGRKCVASLVSDISERVFPVGRLDKDSEGLLLMTNDGAFAYMMTHPTHHISKTYRVTVRPEVSDMQIEALSNGVMVDGQKTAPARVKILDEQPGRVVLEMVLFEGRNREIRKMCEALGLEVARLKRLAVGSIRLARLKAGSHRLLSADEINSLKAEATKGGVKHGKHTAGRK